MAVRVTWRRILLLVAATLVAAAMMSVAMMAASASLRVVGHVRWTL